MPGAGVVLGLAVVASSRFLTVGACLAGLLAHATAVRAQPIPPGVEPESVIVRSGSSPGLDRALPLGTGESVVVWVESDVRAGAPTVGGRPVPDAPVGTVVARFGGSGPFAWPTEPTVWTAPEAGWLAFGLNGHAGHRLEGAARVMVARLEDARSEFPKPRIHLERIEGAIRARWTDRAGFGVDGRRLSLTLTTAHGTVHPLGPWGPVGEREVVLPLPPPVALPPGVHTLSATIVDHLGNRSPRSTITFDTGAESARSSPASQPATAGFRPPRSPRGRSTRR